MANSKIIETSSYLVKIIKEVLHEQEISKIPEGASFSYVDVLSLAKFHQVENITFYALKKYIEDPKILKYIDHKEKQNITMTLVQEEEKKLLAEEFEKRDIDFMPVKGYYNRSLYSRPDFRFMSDLDILYDQKKKSSSKKMMKSLGYHVDTYNYSKDDTYSKEPFVHVELHRSLLMNYHKNYEYYSKIYQKCEVSKENKNYYILGVNDRYLFDIVHLKNHYEESGSGIRNFIDIYLYLTKEKDHLDEAYLEQESRKLEIQDFRKKCEEVALEWFGDKPSDPSLDKMKEYIFTSGVYGTREHSIDHHLNDKHESKFKIIYRRAFPTVKTMRGYYPILNKCILLLPICYFRRLLRAFKARHKVISEIKDVKETKKR